MPTRNLDIAQGWQLIAAPDTDFMLTAEASLEVASTDAEQPPTIAVGHIWLAGETLTRKAIGQGYVWARYNRIRPTTAALTTL